MDKLTKILKEADMTNYPNHIGFLGTDAIEDTDKTFGPRFLEYRKKWARNPKEKIVEDFPLNIDVESTNDCNLKCTMCYRTYLKQKIGVIGNMEFDIYRKIVDEASQNNLPSLKLSFRGEPLLFPRLPEMIRYAKKRDIMEVQFNTNGSLLDKEKAGELLDAGIDRIIFSLDGITPETFNKIRIGTNYDTVVNNIKTLVELRNKKGLKRPSVRVQMVCMRDTKEDILKFVQTWRSIVNRINIIRFRNPIKVGFDKRRISKIPTKSLPCRQLWQRLAVLWDGTVLMCCGDHKASMPLGNVKKDNLRTLWQSQSLNDIRELHSQNRPDEIPLCRGCEVNKASLEGDWNWLNEDLPAQS